MGACEVEALIGADTRIPRGGTSTRKKDLSLVGEEALVKESDEPLTKSQHNMRREYPNFSN